MAKKGLLLIERLSLPVLVMLLDAVAILSGGLVAYFYRFGSWHIAERYLWALIVITLLMLMINNSTGGYRRWNPRRFDEAFFHLIMVWGCVAVFATSLIYFIHVAERYSRLWLVLTMLFSFLVALSFRCFSRIVLSRYSFRGIQRRPVFLVGPGETLLSIARHIRLHQVAGYSICGVHRLKQESTQEELTHVARRVAESGCREVWICMPLSMGDVVKRVMHVLRKQTSEIRFFPELSDLPLLNHRVSEFSGLYSIDLSVSPMTGGARLLKRVEDIVLGGVLSLLVLPVCMVIAICIKLSSEGPVLFKQYRTGINGRRFKVYKFRSMKVHDEKDGKVSQARRGDDRLTSIGSFLRRTSLDELPQFYNVLQGRMSIVGPRPHALAHNEYYQDIVESYMKRHKVKPGITGWAQVNGLRGETDTVLKMEERVEHDLWYINNWSLWLDVKIIFLTIFKGFVNRNAY